MTHRRIVLSLVATSLVVAPPSASAGFLTVVHGIPGFAADVYVNGARTLPAFQAGSMTGAIQLPHGVYRLAVRSAGSPSDVRPVLAARLTLGAHESASVVAHLTPTGARRITIYKNSTPRIPRGKTRLVFRQAAEAPAVDVLVDGRRVLRRIRSGRQGALDLSAGRHRLSITVAGSRRPIWGPSPLAFRSGVSYLVYAIGSVKAGTLDQLVQTIASPKKKTSSPRAVIAGTSGLLDVQRLPLLLRPILSPLLAVLDHPSAVGTPPARVAVPARGWRPYVARLRRVTPRPGPVPVQVRIPRLGVTARIVPTGLEADGSMALPPRSDEVAWYSLGPAPGDAGSAVLAGHVDYAGRAGAFFALATLRPGDRVEVLAGGRERWFRVVARRMYAKPALPISEVFASAGRPALTLITCGGRFNAGRGHYDANVVISAVPA